MKPIHENENGAVYRVDNSPNPICKFQLVIDSIGIFMSRGDLEHLLDIVQQSHAPCHCPECQGKRDKIWCSNPMIDICLKVDEPSLNGLEDLLRQTFFILDMDATLQKNKLIAGSYGGFLKKSVAIGSWRTSFCIPPGKR